MTRPLSVVSAADPLALTRMLRAALSAEGPAVLPRPAAPAPPSGAGPALPSHVPVSTALVIETSGSTGVPKRVQLSRDALLASAAASATALDATASPTDAVPVGDGSRQWLLCLPAHYIAGAQVLVRSIVAGTDPVVYGDAHFDPWAFGRVAAEMTGEQRFVSLVPVQLARMLRAATSDPSLAATMRRFDGILVGGQALEPSLRERALDAGYHVVRTYGSSETGGGCVYDGVPFGSVTARCVDGMLELSGPVLADGYVGDDARTARSFRLDGGVRWYRTGDLGSLAEDGSVVVRGRADSVIISGGEKVLLDAVEAAVHRLAGMASAVVVGADDAEWGQVPVVVVAAEAGSVPSLDAVRAHATAALGRAAAPAAVLVVEELPHLPSGKPDRRALAALAANRHR